jgi:hypothetical protein
LGAPKLYIKCAKALNMTALNCDLLYFEVNVINKIYTSFRNPQDKNYMSNPAALKTKN